MQYLLYCVVCFKVQGTTKEMFMANAINATLANHEVFSQCHAHDAKVALVWHRRANGIPSPSSSDINSP
jgi:hypothetical protein